jgi:transposase
MKKISTVVRRGNEIFKEPKLTIGLDLGDRTSHYCILGEAGEVILEHRVPTTPQGIHQVFSRIPRSRIALETGTHSHWVSRQLTQLSHEVIVAHARNVRLIGGALQAHPQTVGGGEAPGRFRSAAQSPVQRVVKFCCYFPKL